MYFVKTTNNPTKQSISNPRNGLLTLCAAILLCLAAGAQNQPRVSPINAGGPWQEYDSHDPMTDVKRSRFELAGDNPLRNSSAHPKINIYCENGKFLFGHFDPLVRVDPNRPGFWGQPQVQVVVRVDSHNDRHSWNWDGHFLAMDKDSVRGLIGATVFKVQLPGPGVPENIATFSPAGLDLPEFDKACHLKPKH